MLDAEAIIDALLAEVRADGVFHRDAVSTVSKAEFLILHRVLNEKRLVLGFAFCRVLGWSILDEEGFGVGIWCMGKRGCIM